MKKLVICHGALEWLKSRASAHIHTHINTCFMASLKKDPLPKDALSRPRPPKKECVCVCVSVLLFSLLRGESLSNNMDIITFKVSHTQITSQVCFLFPYINSVPEGIMNLNCRRCVTYSWFISSILYCLYTLGSNEGIEATRVEI